MACELRESRGRQVGPRSTAVARAACLLRRLASGIAISSLVKAGSRHPYFVSDDDSRFERRTIQIRRRKVTRGCSARLETRIVRPIPQKARRRSDGVE